MSQAYLFGRWVQEKFAAAPQPGLPPAPQQPPAAQPAAGQSPAQVLAARRVAEAKAMAAKVRGAAGAPATPANGVHRTSGVVLPGGGVQGARYSGPGPRQPVAR